MEGLVLLAVAAALGLLAGAVMGWVALFKLNPLSERVARLERQVQSLMQDRTFTSDTNTANTTRPAPGSTAPSPQPAPRPREESHLLRNIKAHWMVWLGGTCIGFAGIFLAKHSIEQGLLGPGARIALAVIAGLTLHGVAEYLRRATGKSSDVFAALAGGASIMLYAALLAALHLYQLLGPGLTFAALILVSLATMLLALRHGPVLAAIGILGAFCVPVLVSTGSNNVAGALIYSLIITVSALILVRYVFRSWLWIGTITGALGWALLALISGEQIPLLFALYLAGVAYAAMAVYRWDWLLVRTHPAPEDQHFLAVFRSPRTEHQARVGLLLVLILLLQAVGIAVYKGGLHWLVAVPVLPVLLFWVARHNPAFSVFPWLTLIASIGGLLLQGLLHEPDHQPLLLGVLAELAATYLLLSLWLLRVNSYPGVWASLAFLSPVLLLTTGYLLIEQFSTHWGWALASALLGALYLHLVFRQKVDSTQRSAALIVSLTLAAHFAISLALVMLLREATLTLALAVQVISLTWLRRRFPFKLLDTSAKVVLALILARLSLNPWLLTYPTDVHWSLWTYGGSLLCCLAACRLASTANFREWLTGASMHLFVLMLLFEVRYWLYDGAIFADTYSFTEAAINTAVWGALGLVYCWRAHFSQQLARLYHSAGNALLLLALANFGGVVVLAQNPLFADTPVSATPIFNILLLAYGLPVILFALGYRLLQQPYKRLSGVLAGLSLLLFCTLEVRHLWQGGLSLAAPTSDGELYTYSMAWLALAIGGSVWAIRFDHRNLYKGSMILLILVVAKIFLIDMDDLTGLLRAASFMGLGLSLLGLAYLHQRIREAGGVGSAS